MTAAAAPLIRLCEPDKLNPPLNVTLVEDINGLYKVEDFFARERVFGYDAETNITDNFYTRRIRTLQVGNRNEQYVIDLLAFAGCETALIQQQGNYGENKAIGLQYVSDVLRPALENGSVADPHGPRWTKVGANLEFDYIVTRWCLGMRAWHLHDIQIAEKLLHCGRVNFFASGFWALDDIVARYLGLHIKKDEQTSFDLKTPLTQSQIEYCGLDARLPVAIRAPQLKKLVAERLMRVAQIEFDAIPAFGDMHLNGFGFDRARWMELYEENKVKKQDVLKRLDQFFIPVVGQKEGPPNAEELADLEQLWRGQKDKELRRQAKERYSTMKKKATAFKNRTKKGADVFEGEAALNFGSPAQVREALIALEAGFTERNLEDTNDNTFKKLLTIDKIKNGRGGQVLRTMQEYRSIDKLIDTYGEDWPIVSPHTQRVHARFNQMGAETGRASCAHPNLFNLPSRDVEGATGETIVEAKRYRTCFVPGIGRCMVTVDCSGQELRILTQLSGEPVWKDAFTNRWDVHSVCAELLLASRWHEAAEKICAYAESKTKCSCRVHKKFREWLKAVNFGIAYGMNARRLALELGISEAEAKALLEAFRATFPTLIKYLENSAKQAVASMESRTLADRRRLYQRPQWERAREILRKKLKREPNQKEMDKQYRAMFASIEREGMNTPVQGSGADLMKLAMGCGFDPEGKPYLWHLMYRLDALLVNFVYDELVYESLVQFAQEVHDAVQDGICRAGAEFVKIIPMEAEGKIATSWKK